ncbi:MAG: hypothetical protein JXA73_05415 [Acidobacteria bacterium]|nr:hypothetical protein [Acidobacteriota bacterium]
MKKAFVASLILLFSVTSAAIAGVGSRKAAYQGGTTKERDFPGAKKAVEGYLVTENETELRFEYNLNERNRTYSISYKQFIDIEYGQRAGRRVNDSVTTTILYSPVNLFKKLSKKRNHYITIGYFDEESKEQIAVFELGKDIVIPTLHILESRSGKKIVFQDEEDRKSGR